MKNIILKMKIKKYFVPFTYTHHTPSKLLQEFTLHKYNNQKFIPVIKYITELPDFEQVVYLLYLNYNSLRLVAEETNCNYGTIYKIIQQINEKIIKLL